MIDRKPVKGDRIAWRDPGDGSLYAHATVLSVEGNLCWIQPDNGDAAAPFIWHFPREGTMNKLAEILPNSQLGKPNCCPNSPK